MEERLRNEISEWESRCGQLQAAQEAAALEQPPACEARACFDEATDDRNKNTRTEEEWRRLKAEADQRWEQLRFEREQWRTEREGLLADQRRREKVEETLRRQMAGVQERLDSTQLSMTEREQERRRLISQVQVLSEKTSISESDNREADLLLKNQTLETQVHSQHLEMNRLRHQIARLEGERSETFARMAMLPPREDRTGGRGRGRSAVAAGRGACQVGVVRRGAVPAAGRGTSNSISPVTFAPAAVHGRVPAGTLPLHRLRPPDPEPPYESAAARSASCSSCSSSCSESSMGSSSVATDNGHRNSQSQLRAVLGSGPLTKIPDVGWYYRLKIISANTNWCGGFGLGITLSKTANMPTLPDRASRVQYSWHAGYWGRSFSNGVERLSDWKPQELRLNDEVGFLVTTKGECVVTVNDVERCRFGEPLVPVQPEMCLDGEPELTALYTCADGPACILLQGAMPSHLGPAAARASSMVGHTSPSVPPPSTSASPNAAGTAVASPELSPAPPPPSPTQQQRFGPPANIHPPRQGGTSPPPPPPVPPLLHLPSGGIASPPMPAPSQLQFRSPSVTVSAPAAAENSRSAAAVAAARRVPPLVLPVSSCAA